MNPNMFNPEMMNQMKNMINPQMMKQAAENFSSMSDDQIKSYLSASGMGHLSPQMFRQMSGNMKNMDDRELERLKNTAPATNSYSRANSTPTPETFPNTTKTISSDNNSSNFEYSKPKTIIQKLEEMKNLGNDLFRQSKYKESCEKYYEVLNELEYIPDSEKITFKKEIEDLEIVCRLNIANAKLKLEDYDLVINECLKVLKKSDNFKAHYRCGLSFYKKGNYSKASLHFTKAKEINKTEEAQQIEKYLKECQINLDDIERDKQEDLNRENERELERQKEIDRAENVNKMQTSESTNEPKKMSKYEKLKEIVNKEVKLENSTSKNRDEILIEEDKPKKSREYREENVNTNMNYNSNNFNPDLMSKAERELKNMNENDMGGMVNMLKSMDNATIKSMMQMQGMSLSDEQISMMKNNINPETMKMMKNYQGGMPKGNFGNTQNNGQNTSFSNNSNSNSSNSNLNSNTDNNLSNETVSTTPPPMKGFPDMKNMDLSSMMKMVQDNPNIMNMLGPQMSQMFGGGQGGMDNNVMMKSMQNILWLMSMPQRTKSFFTSTRGIILTVLIVGLIISYFYR